MSAGIHIRLTIGSAPAVYDPGGATALVQKIIQPSEIAVVERIAFDEKALISISPARTTDLARLIALKERGYHVSSEWLFVRSVGPSPRQ